MDHEPTPISKKSLDRFKAIWREKHGETLSDDEVAEMAGRLLRVVSVFLRLSARATDPSGVRTASGLTEGPEDIYR